MRLLGIIILGLVCGLLGMLAGWFGLAMAVLAFVGSDREGAAAMGAFFDIGPVGGVVGFVLGVVVFRKFGLARRHFAPATSTPLRISRSFAAGVLLIAAGLGGWGWWEFIRSPYLSHGFMKLSLQFRLPDGMALPTSAQDVTLQVTEGGGRLALISIREDAWHGHDGNRAVILASASLMYKGSPRTVTLSLPGLAADTWVLDLPSDLDPMRDFSPWAVSGTASVTGIEMNYLLEKD